MFVTWYTNPFTIVPLYLVAYELGRWLLGSEPQAWGSAPDWTWTLAGMWQWVLSLGKPLGVGMVALAVLLARSVTWSPRSAGAGASCTPGGADAASGARPKQAFVEFHHALGARGEIRRRA